MKFVKEALLQAQEEQDRSTPNIVSSSEFTQQARPPSFIWEKVLQRNLVYSATAKWGHGKTALFLTVAIHIALGRDLAGLRVEQTKVLYLAGENPDDIRLRVIAICKEYQFDIRFLDDWLCFSDRSFAINQEDAAEQVALKAKKHGNFGLIIVDTGVAHHDTDEENSNTEMHKFAVACRSFGNAIGNPALVVLMHPTQGATRENLRTRGGGGFAGNIDAELLLWQNEITKQIEFFHSSKFRGAGFSPLWFDLKTVWIDGFTDNFGNEASSVVVIAGERKEGKDPKNLSGDKLKVYNAILPLLSRGGVITKEDWRAQFYSENNQRPEEFRKSTAAAKKSFDRCSNDLLEAGLVLSNGGCLSFPTNEEQPF
jgi:hypothetical protein